MNKLLIHSCCAPCSSGVFTWIEQENLKEKTTFYFYNPNIHPFLEYQLRKNCFIKFMKKLDVDFRYDDEYDLGFNNCQKPDRCEACYRKRLARTARIAVEYGFDNFTTTLLISPYQDHELIKSIGREYADKYNLTFLYKDFRDYYKLSRQLSFKYNLYRQQYCGCFFSEYERYAGELDKKGKIRQVRKLLKPMDEHGEEI